MDACGNERLADLGAIVLAHTSPFKIGRLHATPATRQIAASDGRSETIEPRVMQVLVALARSGGAIVTRDELIAWCWSGRIVSDDAINRSLSRLRQIASGIGNGSFAVETIPRVGYRIIDKMTASFAPPVPAVERQSSPLANSRRALIVGGATMGALAIWGLWWNFLRGAQTINEAQRFLSLAIDLSREALPGQNRQVAVYLERAVAIDPDYAAAWGLLSLAYSRELEHSETLEPGTLPARIESAARRALALDPANADATLGLIFITPSYRHWAEKERQLRQFLAAHPNHWLARGRLAVLLQQVGRLNECVAQGRQALAIEPMLPAGYGFLIAAYDALGRIQEAEAAIDTARTRWPAHPFLWRIIYAHLLFGGRARDAAAFAADPAQRPAGLSPAVVAAAEGVAQAAASERPDVRSAAAAEIVARIERDATAIPSGARALALLGQPEPALAALDRYLLDRGPFGPPRPIGPYTRRVTDMLFAPPLRALRGHPRYDALIRDIGLGAYWSSTGTAPDV